MKPELAATSYMWIYVASSPEDAISKEAEHLITLDRNNMWDATKIKGCKSKYEFETIIPRDSAGNNMRIRRYPCPCRHCTEGVRGSKPCELREVVGEWEYVHLEVSRISRSDQINN